MCWPWPPLTKFSPSSLKSRRALVKVSLKKKAHTQQQQQQQQKLWFKQRCSHFLLSHHLNVFLCEVLSQLLMPKAQICVLVFVVFLFVLLVLVLLAKSSFFSSSLFTSICEYFISYCSLWNDVHGWLCGEFNFLSILVLFCDRCGLWPKRVMFCFFQPTWSSQTAGQWKVFWQNSHPRRPQRRKCRTVTRPL